MVAARLLCARLPKIALASLETGEHRVLIEGGGYGRYVPTGHLVYGRNGTLLAVPFDLDRLEVTGPSLPVLDDVRMLHSGTGVAFFESSRTGSLLYVPGALRPEPKELLWVDRQGKVEPLTNERRAYGSPRLSPDGDRLAVHVETPTGSDIWVHDLSRETWTRLTFAKDKELPVWSPDGKWLAFVSNRDGPLRLFRVPVDGSGEPERLAETTWGVPRSWSPDGRFLAFDPQPRGKGVDVWVLSLEGEWTPRPFVSTEHAEESGEFSPNGQFVAYSSNESGRMEVYVRPFPGPGRRWQVSQGGGSEPRWAQAGRELLYLGQKVMSVSVSTERGFQAGRPRALCAYGERLDSWDVARDGQRFVMVQSLEQEPDPLRMVIITNWFEELKAKFREAGQ